ncbi:ankyrin repeat domain-containing protein [Leptospira biflexa]|uniref:ankyrin repeat domain-containing protein n=1 Tax=Leptospira biflexa TaxID=172 RepID=UPI0010916FAC|nr:ankyrin repeat domain-containing protein [Leptospira biflexa]TGM43982.1 ankyrin repeat domain-containing protein [Leptospira biflexa]TGM44884.1 ankyrin repeat domain-containing protein [Leptospira biflexa]
MQKSLLFLLRVSVSLLPIFSCTIFELKCADCTLSEAYENKEYIELLQAVIKGDKGKLETLINNGANPNYLEDEKLPLLIWAICANNLDSYEVLLKAGGDPNMGGNFQKDIRSKSIPEDGWSSMVYASALSNPSFLKMAIKYGGDLNAQKGNSGTGFPLLVATRFGQFENIKILIEAGADINIHNEKYTYYSAPILAITTYPRYDIAIWLLEHGYNFKLEELAGIVELIAVNQTYQPEKEKLIKILEKRGIQFPRPNGRIAREVKMRNIPEKDIMDIVYG